MLDKIVPFEEWHYYFFLAEMMPRRMQEIRRLEPYIKAEKDAMTWKVGEKVYVIGGVSEMWPGVGEAWVLVTEDALKKPIALTKVVRGFLNMAKYKYWRIQATVEADFREGNRWMRSLGFSQETDDKTPMLGYGPNGRDYHMYHYEGVTPWPDLQ